MGAQGCPGVLHLRDGYSYLPYGLSANLLTGGCAQRLECGLHQLRRG